LQLKVGGKFHLKLNTGGRPIAYKYREGKMQQNFEKRVKEYLKLLKRKRRKPVPAASYFPDRLRLGRCGQRCQAWLVWAEMRVGRPDLRVTALGATEVDEMVFFPPSRNTDQGV
jgi:hypothetical protein